MLDSVVKARHGTGAPTAADSVALRGAIQGIVDVIVGAPKPGTPNTARPGPEQCHDITAYPAIGLAGGACAGYGLLLDIHDVAHPRRIGAVSDSNFSYWHSATFNNDGTKVLFTDEWGGGGGPKCRVTDRHEWGADAIFTLDDKRMTFRSYYKLPAPQTELENCVAHNGSLIPIPGRDIMAQSWYQGGVSGFEWTRLSHPRGIAFFDRGPMDGPQPVGAGSWSAYWYNGHIYSSEIARGLDVLDLVPSGFLSNNEIAAAELVHWDYFNTQDQPHIVWPASFVVAGAYVDQLARSNGLAPERVAAVRQALDRAQKLSGAARRGALTQTGTQLGREAAERRELGETLAHRPHDPPAARHRAQPHRRAARHHHPGRYAVGIGEVQRGRREGPGPEQLLLRHQQADDDAHGFLRVVGSVPERIRGGRADLEHAEGAVDLARERASQGPRQRHRQRQRQHEAHERRQHDEDERGDPFAGEQERREARLRHRGARVAADQGVRRRGGQPEPPGDEVPDDGAAEPSQDHGGVHGGQVHEPLAHGLGHRRPEQEDRNEVERRGPDYGGGRRQYPGRHHGGDGVRRVLEPVDQVEAQRGTDAR